MGVVFDTIREHLPVDWLARSPFCFFCVVDLRLFINAGSFRTKINLSLKSLLPGCIRQHRQSCADPEC